MPNLHVLIDPARRQTFRALRALWGGTLRCSTPGVTPTPKLSASWRAWWTGAPPACGGGGARRSRLANPDLIDLLVLGRELNEPDVSTFYASGPAGYIDYPTLGRDGDARAPPEACGVTERR